ncbi:MAG: DUF354 domain-containing protein [Bacteroidota bacterium]|nr:DUF354 domain-containing protein [Bacteroidota bacterium]
MKLLFYLGHPAHYHLFKHVIRAFKAGEVLVLIKSKDVLEQLLIEEGVPYINIDHKTGVKTVGNTLAIAKKFGRRMLGIAHVIRKEKPTMLVGCSAELALLGKFFRIPSCAFFEDDLEKVKSFAMLAGPTATYLICPDVCSAWKWEQKKIGHNSYHELAYLHPDHFKPDFSLVSHMFEKGTRNFIIRFSELGAYHDVDKQGINDELALTLIDMLKPHGRVYITSERPLPSQFESYRIAIKSSHIHHALYFADMFIGDSQTMTAESAVLGTPALRFNDFVGELGYLEDLEHTYGLTYGFRTSESEGLLNKLDELLNDTNLKEQWQQRRMKMLDNKVNFANWMISFLNTRNKKS